MNFSLSSEQIANITKGELIGSPNLYFSSLQRIEYATLNDISFCLNKDFLEIAKQTKPGLLILFKGAEYQVQKNQAAIFHDKPYHAFAQLLIYINNNFNKIKSGIRKSASISMNAIIGDNPTILENVVIEANVKIGKNCLIHPNVVIKQETIIGDNVIIHPGAVIGSDGFGYLDNADGSYTKIPQLGNVIIGNNVEIGANVCIDRALIGSTIIADGVKIDNLTQIAHNVEIGENSAFASQVGISGSTKIGKRVRMGGQVGSSGHIEIADDVTILAQSGVASSVTKKGIYFGSPIKPRLDAFKIEAVIKNLPNLQREVFDIKRKLEKEQNKL